MTNFTEDQLAQLKAALQKRYLELQEEVRRELGVANGGRDIYDVSNIPDDIDTALVDRQINEMRELEVSQKHLMELEIGDCIDCGDEIGFERLLVYPSAQRCIVCQKKYEKAYPHEPTPTL
jgi:RNA polymerase-binding transcription factor DksA